MWPQFPFLPQAAETCAKLETYEVVCPIVSSTYPFAVASFYEQWSDLTDKEVIESLDTFKKTAGGHHD